MAKVYIEVGEVGTAYGKTVKCVKCEQAKNNEEDICRKCFFYKLPCEDIACTKEERGEVSEVYFIEA